MAATSIPDHCIVKTAPHEDRVGIFPDSTPLVDHAFLKVDEIHSVSASSRSAAGTAYHSAQICYSVYGNPSSNKVAVYLHGGPGAGVSARAHRMFDPEHYRVIVFDQRGAGKSTPNGEIARANTTWDLVADIERLREEVGKVEKFHVVYGGSWGSTLALAYAEKHPDRLRSLVLRGIFLFDQCSIDWLFNTGGASEMYPDAFSTYSAHIAPGERGNLLGAYHRRVMSDDMEIAIPAAREFVRWELSVSTLQCIPDEAMEAALADTGFVLPFARAECHYFVNGGWFPDPAAEAEGLDPGLPSGATLSPMVAAWGVGGPSATGSDAVPYLLRHADRIAHIPTWIVHGRQDIVCRPRAAFELHRRLSRCRLEYVHDAGHSEGEPGTTSRLIAATNEALALPED
jgi:proline iminopeptidase